MKKKDKNILLAVFLSILSQNNLSTFFKYIVSKTNIKKQKYIKYN